MEYQDWLRINNLEDSPMNKALFEGGVAPGVSLDFTPRSEVPSQGVENRFGLDTNLMPESMRAFGVLDNPIPTEPVTLKGGQEAIKEMEQSAHSDKKTDDGSLQYYTENIAKSFINTDPIEVEARSGIKPIEAYEDPELEQIIAAGPGTPNYENAWNEKLMRSRWTSQSFWENLRDPDWAKRKFLTIPEQLAAAVPKIPGQIASLAGVVSAPQAMVAEKLGFPQLKENITEPLLQAGDEYNKAINDYLEMRDPQDWVEGGAAVAGGAVPVGGAAAAGLTGIRSAAEFITPLTIGGGKRAAGNVAAQFFGSEALRPFIDPDGSYQGLFNNFKATDEAVAAGSDPEIDFHVGTGKDGQIFRNSDLTKLGILGLATIGLGVTPSVVNKIWKGPALATPRQVDPLGINAPKDLYTIERTGDLLNTYLVNPAEGIKGIMKRAGVDSEDLFTSIDTNTSSALNQKISSALETGISRNLDGDYVSAVSANRLSRAIDGLDEGTKQAFNRYAMLKDMLDDFGIYGSTMLNGMSKNAVLRGITDLENQFPDLTKIHGMWNELQAAGRDYASSGRWAIFSAKKKAELARTRKNYVPYELEDVDPNLPVAVRASRRASIMGAKNAADPEHVPFAMKRGPHLQARDKVNASDLIHRSVENIVRAKTLNAVRGEIIESLKKSSIKGLVVEVKAKDLEKNPAWKNRTIDVYEKGQLKHYVMSQSVADIVRFDPNFARFPGFFGTSRVFQFNTTGYGAPWFAFTHFLRDAVVGNILKRPEDKFFGPVASVTAIGKQLKAQATKGLSNSIYKMLDSDNGIGQFMKTAFGENNLRGVADTLADSYVNSYFHIFTSNGGLNVNMARNAYKQAHTAMDEILSKVEAPPHVKSMAGTWANIIDAIQNAPHYAYLEKNTKALSKKKGRKLDKKEYEDLIKSERELTGNVSEAGKVYTRSGRQIGTDDSGAPSDITNEGWGSLATIKAGPALQGLRELSPWTNALISGLRQTGKVYWKNPWRFMGRAGAIYLMPTTLSYFGAASLGPEYLEYMMTGRSEYQKSTSIYIPPFWGGKPEDGIEVPMAYEVAPLVYMYLNQLDYVFRNGGSEMGTISSTMLQNYFGLTMPPALSAVAGYAGFEIPHNISLGGGDIYKPKEDAWDNLPQNVDLVIRALMGSAADVWVGGLNSFLEDGDISAAIEEAQYQAGQKVAIVKGNKVSAQTDINEKHFEFNRKLEELDDLWKLWSTDTETGEQYDDVDLGGKYNKPINTYDGKLFPQMGPAITPTGRESKKRKDIVGEPEEVLGKTQEINAGLPKFREPTNPVYIALSQRIHDIFQKRTGEAKNFSAMKGQLKTVTEQVQALKRVTAGNMPTWKKRMEELFEPEFLKQFNLNDRDTPRIMINEFEHRRVKILKLMETYVKEAEDQLTSELQQAGQLKPGERVDLMKLDPYASPTGP